MKQEAWVISVNMGYGHQRTAYPLRNLAPDGKVINANSYQGIPERDKKIWETTRNSYEFISRFQRFPLVGKTAFLIYDQFQKILTFYPKRDLSKPNFVLKQIYSSLKKGWGRGFIEKLKSQNEKLPIISTFFTPAFMAEFFNYPGEIFCVVCDADISRTWAPLNPKLSKIKYFASTERVVERLKLYGVKPENIFLTGYPLPKENIGTKKMEVLKEDLKYRILNLDSQKRYFAKYKILIEENLGKLPDKSDHPLTILFSVGGAGAQKEIGIKILKCLIWQIKQREIKIILSAGIKERVKEYFERELKKLKCNENNSRYIEIIFEKDIGGYFQKFNLALRKTDILWTKPSELSFYSALGIPIIIAPPIGSQEEFNKRWLLKSGFGLLQEDPAHAEQWLFDWLERGYLAEAAMEGFIEGEKLGTLNIQKIITK
ncbi:MAG: hypothetical protein COU43_02910 [Candidatus Nealsonbacteria bacterium CG10_big_fil_rev_8_21_14_0_10_37_25]|uniref:DUF6938 domain-containing protein n=2 Tax=Candidatus Nealsoniibacteriota TaxID=1817911 RepID=A0A2H0TIN8_9BACT|nr:MAG: hypothetical protein COU43_02910 [Candidatus Nealsonbacteria bacterium CG10_big_fil_rev_8_21_14_0_10_37_25]